VLVNHVKEFFRKRYIVYVVHDSPVTTCMIAHPFLEIPQSNILLFGLTKQFLELVMRHERVQVFSADLTFVNNSLFSWRLLHVHAVRKVLYFVFLLLLAV
jgi:hypothetical protein